MDTASPFTALLNDLHQHRAMLYHQGQAQYGAATIDQAIHTKHLKISTTELGPVLLLAHKGRKNMGLCGAYNPSPSALVNAVAVRQVTLDLRQQGYQVCAADRRATLKAGRAEEAFVLVARYTGFDQATVRRLFQQFIQNGLFPELRVYVAPAKVEGLRQALPRHLPGSHVLKVVPIPGF